MKSLFIVFRVSAKMSVGVVESAIKSANPDGNGDKLGDLVDKMDNVKINETEEDPEKLIKHPLQNAWTLWFFKNDKARTWEENQRPIITVTTVEDFWSLYNHIEVASRLPPGRVRLFLVQGRNFP